MPLPQPPGEMSESDMASGGAGGGVREAGVDSADPGSVEDARGAGALMRECLPVALLALVTGGEKAIVGCLRELVGLGWQPFQIRELLSVAAPPPNVVNGPGLVLYRLSQLKYRDVPDPFVGNSLVAREKRRERFACEARGVLEQISDGTCVLPRPEQFMWLNRTASLESETAYKEWAKRLWDKANNAFEAREGVVLRV
ncbi:hypothetical protein [Actinotignum urinale]|uniref:Uncharacterized protein n=1 Tax=Actinotignum urinale TaxID=190146 RepID=A0AAW9HP24_9ACTO|nr:hypothetical protein [Actinotignum urinale]MDY5155673.1 hypothetical protein [Actinotignum urinale]